MPYGDVKAGLFGFVFDENFPCSLVIQQHLSQDEFQIILVHVIARARYLIISHVREIEGGAVAMTALRDGIDVSAALQVFDILLVGSVDATLVRIFAFLHIETVGVRD